MFLASPGDVKTERQAVREFFEQYNRTTAKPRGVEFTVIDWENYALADVGRPQELITRETLERFRPSLVLVVGIMAQRFGSDTGEYESGTEEEFECALKYKQETGRPRTIFFFRKESAGGSFQDVAASFGQWEKVEAFRRRLEDQKLALYESYDQTPDFPGVLHNQLTAWLNRLDQPWWAAPTESEREQIDAAVSTSSADLLEWPQETGGRWIERPEVEQLAEVVKSTDSSFIALSGAPGSGKSALLARVGNLLKGQDIALLAIKADELPASVNSAAALQQHLGLDVPVIDALRALRKTSRVALLVDQLDALADLMDLHTKRLTVLLGLIRAAVEEGSLHVIISCREFELHHDTRLSRLKAKEIKLPPLGWAEVADLLKSQGIDSTNWPEDARDLLCIPQNLKVFIDFLPRTNGGYRTYQSMLEAAWQKVEAECTPEALALCHRIARKIADTEELWQPLARFPGATGEFMQLLRSNVLKISSDGLRLTFAHQTMFEFVQARTFVAEHGEGLAEYVRHRGLFVRPTLWKALQYMRAAEPAKYRKEVMSLLGDQDLRPHILDLILRFLGQLEDPDPTEVGWMEAVINEQRSAGRALRFATGHVGWFRALLRRLPAWMTRSEKSAWDCVGFLRAGAAIEPDTVASLVKEHWLQSDLYHPQVLSVFHNWTVWDERIARMLEILIGKGRTPNWYVSGLASKVGASHPGLAARLVATQIIAEYDSALQAEIGVSDELTYGLMQSDDPVERMLARDRRRVPFEEILFGGSGWYGLADVARQAPSEFLSAVWPIFVKICTRLSVATAVPGQFCRPESLDLQDDRDSTRRTGFVDAVGAAVEVLAAESPTQFEEFVAANAGSDLLIVQSLLARGFEAAPEGHAASILGFLLEDERRLSIGGMEDRHSRTKGLIRAAAPHWSIPQSELLVNKILEWAPFSAGKGDDAKHRREVLRWNREHRLRLLRAFPDEALTPEVIRFREEEERAMPELQNWDAKFDGVSIVTSPVSVDQMAKARDADVLRVFEGRTDEQGWAFDGSVEAAREFASLAKSDPERALRLIRAFEPGRHERPAGYALLAMSEEGAIAGSRIVGAAHGLSSRGFSGAEFRTEVARGLEKVARQLRGLDDPTCSLLAGWLEQPDGPAEGLDSGDDDSGRGGILWGRHFVTLPGGNHAILRAITMGYLLRDPPAHDLWLKVLEGHFSQPDSLAVWSALAAGELRWLRGAGDEARAQRLLTTKLRGQPSLILCTGTVHLIARLRGWLPLAFVHYCIRTWMESAWARGPQAAGEVATLYGLLFPEDPIIRKMISDAFQAERLSPTIRQGFRTGVAHTATHAWQTTPELRQESGKLIRQLMTDASEPELVVLAGVLHDIEKNIDAETTAMLKEIPKHPPLVRQIGGYGVLHLDCCLSGGVPAPVVAEFALAMVKAGASELGNQNTGWSLHTRELFDLSLTLHRIDDTREVGLEIFEQLLAADAVESVDILRKIDRTI